MGIKLGSLLSFFLVWLGLTGNNTDVVLVLFLIIMPLIVYRFALALDLLPKHNAFNYKVFRYCLWLAKEIFNSTIAVIRISWRKNLMIRPSIELVKSIQTSPSGVITYANSITLTPGTVTLSVDDQYLLVHALDTSFIEDVKTGQMDQKIKQIIK